MNDDFLKLWTERTDTEPPAGFTDRVMAAVHREPPPSSKSVPFSLQSSPAVRIGACVLACLACLYRMAAVVAVFFVQ